MAKIKFKKSKASREEAPKKSKKKTATATRTKKAVKAVATVTKLSPETKGHLSEMDRLSAQQDTIAKKRQKTLAALMKSLDGAVTFEHPKLGLTTIMRRDDTLFWRPKPQGAPKQGKVSKSATKAVKAKKAAHKPAPPKAKKKTKK